MPAQRLRRFAILLRLEAQGVSSLTRPLYATKVHPAFVSFRLALTHVGEPAHPLAAAPARGPPGWDKAAEPLPVCDAMEHLIPGTCSIRASVGNASRPTP